MGIFDFLLPQKTKNTEITISSSENDLNKSVKPTPNTDFLKDQVDKNKAVFSLDSKQYNTDRIYQKRGRLLDRDLRDIASYDAIISLIVNTRANQLMSFGKKSRNKYDRGFIIQEDEPIKEKDYLSKDEIAKVVAYRARLAKQISEYVAHCGTRNEYVLDYVFKGSDSYFKECTLAQYLAAQAQNLLVFGRCATQVFRNKDGVPIMFRPLPVESIYRVIDQEEPSISENNDDTQPESVKDFKEYKDIEEGRRPVAYVQRMDGKNVAFFTEDEIIMTYMRKQAYENLDGYPYSPIEQAYYTVSMHFYAQQYMQNAFTKGLASKGIINLKTAEGGVVSPEMTEMFRKTFSNYVARNDNSATIPVISGPIDVEFIELNATAKDMEFVQLYNKVIMILCAAFQISPQEIGFGNLDSAQPSLGEGSKQDQIVQGEERGLRQLVDCLYGTLDSIIHAVFPESAGVLHFEAIGLGQNTKEADLALYKEELQTSGTFGKIWADSEHMESFPFGGNVPTSPLFWNGPAKIMKMSELRHYFGLEEGAINNPALDFFLDPAAEAAYQALHTGSLQAQSDAAHLQNASAAVELSMQEGQAAHQPVQQEAELAQMQQQQELEQSRFEAEQQAINLEKQQADAEKLKEAEAGAAEFLKQIIEDREPEPTLKDLYGE